MFKRLALIFALVCGLLFVQAAAAQTPRYVLDKTFKVRIYLDRTFRTEYSAAEQKTITDGIFAQLKDVYAAQLAFNIIPSDFPVNNAFLGAITTSDAALNWLRDNAFHSSNTIDILLVYEDLDHTASNATFGMTKRQIGSVVTTKSPDDLATDGSVITTHGRLGLLDIEKTAVHEVGHFLGHSGLGRLPSAGTCLGTPLQIMCEYNNGIKGVRTMSYFLISDIQTIRGYVFLGDPNAGNRSPARIVDCYQFGPPATAPQQCTNYCGNNQCVFNRDDPIGYDMCVNSCQSTKCSRICVN